MSDSAAELRADAAAMERPEPDQAAAPGEVIEASDDLLPAVAGAVHVAGRQLCARYRVTPLERREEEMLSAALLNVARVYGLLDRADPKIMALLTLGGVSMTILGNRQRLPEPEPAAEPANADAAAAA